MQIQHESTLVEASLSPRTKAADLRANYSQTLDEYTILQVGFSSIALLAPSPVAAAAPGAPSLAAYSRGSNQINLIDTRNASRRDKFSLKPCDKRFSRQSFVAKGMDFSPDGSRLAVGQSDCIIYIYKIGQQQELNSTGPDNHLFGSQPFGKPVISGKFVCSSPVTCLVWTELGIVFGTRDGKLKLVSFAARQVASLDSSSSAVVGSSQSQVAPGSSSSKVINIFSSPRGAMPVAIAAKLPVIAASFADGSVQTLLLFQQADANQQHQNHETSSETLPPQSRRNSSNQQTTSVAVGPSALLGASPPSQLAFVHQSTNQLCCACSDGRLTFFALDQLVELREPRRGQVLLEAAPMSVAHLIELKEEIIAMDYSQTNDMLALATRSRISFVVPQTSGETIAGGAPTATRWQLQPAFIEFLPTSGIAATPTSLRWLRDGGQLAVGTQLGSLELFKCSWSGASALNDRLDICHIAPNRLRISDRERNLLATYRTQLDIKRVNLFDAGQNVLIWTSGSLLMARLGQPAAQSEIKWRRELLTQLAASGSAGVKFRFHPAGFVIILLVATWELSLVRLGQDFVCYSTKLDARALNKKLQSLSCFPRRLSWSPSSAHLSAGATSNNQRTNSAKRESFSTSSPPQIDGSGANADQAPSTGVNRKQSAQQVVHQERLAYASHSAQCLNLVELSASSTRRLIARHDQAEPIVWLELSCTGKYLAWRDAKNRLTLMQITSVDKSARENDERKDGHNDKEETEDRVRLHEVSFSSWIEESDILVAQSRHKIYVWYKIERLRHPTIIDSGAYNILKRAPIIDLADGYTLDRAHKATRNEDSTSLRSGKFPEIRRLGSSEISLSNGCSIPLDDLFVNFHREIIDPQRHEWALRLLEKEAPAGRVSLWAQLGWSAIREENIELAVKAFGAINHASMVRYLQLCLASVESDDDGGGQWDEARWRLAKLSGDWELFERLQDPETVVATYKRLNKWTRCIEYLSRGQQFKQRELAEREFSQWLLARGRHLEAARLQAQQWGDLEGAIKLLVASNNHDEAAKLVLEERTSSDARGTTADSLTPIVGQLKNQLVARGSLEMAAKICKFVLGDEPEALELYLRAELYEEALELATSRGGTKNDEQQVREIKKKFAGKLLEGYRCKQVAKQRAMRSIQLYLESKALTEALEAALELDEPRKALEVLLSEAKRRSMADEKNGAASFTGSLEYCERVGAALLAANLKSDAIRAYQLAERHSKVLELMIETKNFDEAFRVSLEHIHKGDAAKAREEFRQLAQQMVAADGASNDFDSAEKLLLVIGDIDAAIEMHRASGNHERLIALVEQHQPECMESQLLLLAKRMEQAGQLAQAEAYLLRAGPHEWTNVVRMYRLANRWDEAYRVARAHCRSAHDPLLVQLAYFWAKAELASAQKSDSSSQKTVAIQSATQRARDLLTSLGCLDEVLEFSCENGNFLFALDLCRQKPSDNLVSNSNDDDDDDAPQTADDRQRRQIVVSKYAKHLERKQDLRAAEKVLAENGQLEEAVRMYFDNGLHADAIRVIEEAQRSASQQQRRQKPLVDLLNRSLVEAANSIASSASHHPAQAGSLGNRLVNGAGGGADAAADMSRCENLLAQAQQMYLRAQRPELAIEMYRSRGQWQEAIQLAQRFAPQLLESLESDLDAQLSADLRPILAARDAAAGTTKTMTANAAAAAATSGSRSSSSSRSLSSSLATTTAVTAANGEPELVALVEGGEQFLQARAERFMRRGQDPGKARRALDRLLANLADGDSQNEAACLILGEKLTQLERQLGAPSLDAVRRIHSLADQLLQLSCPLIGGASGELLSVWRKCRNLMASSMVAELAPAKLEQDQHQRKLLAIHFAILQRALAQQVLQAAGGKQVGARSPELILGPLAAQRLASNLELAGKQANQWTALVGLLWRLSMSLLRYSDLLDARACFLSAGFWTLVGGRASLARFAWTRLMELVDAASGGGGGSSPNVNGRANATTRLAAQLAQADCPAAGCERDSAQLVPSNYKSLGEIRSWLIETLLESGASLELAPLESDGRLGSSLRNFQPCLVSGYPVLEPARGGGGGGSQSVWRVRQADWWTLKELAGWPERRPESAKSATHGCQLHEIVQFIESLLNK